MKSILLLTLFFALPSLAQYADQDLAKYFSDAQDPISFEDFPDALTQKRLNCSYRWNAKWNDITNGIGIYTKTTYGQGQEGRGPLFPDMKGKEIITRSLVYGDNTVESYENLLGQSKIILTDRELTWNVGGAVYIFRKQSPYFFFKVSWSGNNGIGYCWPEKN